MSERWLLPIPEDALDDAMALLRPFGCGAFVGEDPCGAEVPEGNVHIGNRGFLPLLCRGVGYSAEDGRIYVISLLCSRHDTPESITADMSPSLRQVH